MIAAPSTLKTDDQIVNYYAEAVAAIGTEVPFVDSGLSAVDWRRLRQQRD